MTSWCVRRGQVSNLFMIWLTYLGLVTHICIGKLIINASDNGLSPGQRQAIIWTNAGILLTEPLVTNFSEILIKIQTFSLTKICLKMSSAKCCPFCLSLDMLTGKKLRPEDELSLKWVLEYDKMWALVQVMAWCQRGDKPIPEPRSTKATRS